MLTGKFALFGLNSRYSVLLGLTAILFDVIRENASLRLNTIVEKVDVAS